MKNCYYIFRFVISYSSQFHNGNNIKNLVFLILIYFFFSPVQSKELQDDAHLEDQVYENKLHWLPGIELNSIQKYSIPQSFMYCIWCAMAPHGWGGSHIIFELSPGTYGNSVSLGINIFAGLGLTNLAGKITVLRSTRTGFNVVDNNTYVGPEVSVNLLAFDIEIGILRNTTNTANSKSNIISIGIGLGL